MTETSNKPELIFGEEQADGSQVEMDPSLEKTQGNADDRTAMWRMGKIQELKRDFSALSIFGFTMILIASWESVMICSGPGLLNGGTAGLIWIYLICWIAFFFIYLSLAEMASMAPTSGGQYHWVSEFSPRQYQKFLSYTLGWMSVLGWQALTAGTAFVFGTLVQGMIVLNHPDYVSKAWHGCLLTIAGSAATMCCNLFLAHKLPLIEGTLVIIHILGFFAVLVTMWVLSPTGDPKTVFTTFSDGGEWGSLGGSALVGITSGILPLLGADAAVHMAEEVKDAARALPKSMLTTTAVNGVAGLVMMITYAFCIAAMDLDEILSSDTGYPLLQVFYNITGTAGGATGLGMFPAIFAFAGTLTMVATTSRQLYAFARDSALPFSPWLAKVNQRQLPQNAILLTFATTSLLSLISLGSASAFNDITSLSTCALLTAYMVCIGCMIWRRLTNAPLLPSPFSLGRFGLAVNIIAEVFVVIFLVLAFFPEYKDTTAETMNWNIAIYAGVTLFAQVYYFFYGSHVYVGPVEYVRKLE